MLLSSSSPAEESKRSIDFAATGFYAVCTLLAGLTAATVPFLRRYGGAPYVASAPAARAAIRTWLQTYQQSTRRPSPLRFTDLGSGGGEFVFIAAKAGFQARGVELNWWLVLRSRLRAYQLSAELRNRVEFKRQDLWTSHLDEEDVVVVFGVPDMMKRVGELVERQCKNGCIVCCNTFPIPGWKPMKKKGGVYFYNVGDQRRERFTVRGAGIGIAEAANEVK